MKVISLDAHRRIGDRPEISAAYPLARDEILLEELGSRVMAALIEEAIIPESVVADRIHHANQEKEAHGWKPRIIK